MQKQPPAPAPCQQKAVWILALLGSRLTPPLLASRPVGGCQPKGSKARKPPNRKAAHSFSSRFDCRRIAIGDPGVASRELVRRNLAPNSVGDFSINHEADQALHPPRSPFGTAEEGCPFPGRSNETLFGETGHPDSNLCIKVPMDSIFGICSLDLVPTPSSRQFPSLP